MIINDDDKLKLSILFLSLGHKLSFQKYIVIISIVCVFWCMSMKHSLNRHAVWILFIITFAVVDIYHHYFLKSFLLHDSVVDVWVCVCGRAFPLCQIQEITSWRFNIFIIYCLIFFTFLFAMALMWSFITRFFHHLLLLSFSFFFSFFLLLQCAFNWVSWWVLHVEQWKSLHNRSLRCSILSNWTFFKSISVFMRLV